MPRHFHKPLEATKPVLVPTPEQATVLDLMSPAPGATEAALEAEAEALVELDHLALAEHLSRVVVDPSPEEVAFELGYRQAMLDAVHRCKLERSGHSQGDTIIQNCIGSIQGMNSREAVLEWQTSAGSSDFDPSDYGAII